MSHLDEGRIAEFLDEGERSDAPEWADVRAHLADCASCRASLEEQRRLRGRAAGILADSGPPDTLAPPFEDVLQHAGRASRTGRWMRPLAWAATVALAAGVGWYGRGLVLSPAGPEPNRVVAAPAPDRDAAEREAVDRLAERTAPSEQPAAGPASQEARARRDPSPSAVADEERIARSVLAQRERERPEGLAAAAVADSRAAGERGAGQVAAVIEPAVTGRAAPAPRVVPIEPPVALRDAAPEPAAAPTPAADELRRAERDRVDAWRVVDLNEAERLLGGSVMRVDGLATLGHAVRLERGAYTVRTTQQLGEAELELVQRQLAGAGADRPVPVAADSVTPRREVQRRQRLAAAQASGASRTTTIERDGFTITVTAPVPLDSLRALLARLRP